MSQAGSWCAYDIEILEPKWKFLLNMLAGGNYEVTVQLAPLWRVPMLARLTDEPFTGTWKFSPQQIKIEIGQRNLTRASLVIRPLTSRRTVLVSP